jgi:hypothetical protein
MMRSSCRQYTPSPQAHAHCRQYTHTLNIPSACAPRCRPPSPAEKHMYHTGMEITALPLLYSSHYPCAHPLFLFPLFPRWVTWRLQWTS